MPTLKEALEEQLRRLPGLEVRPSPVAGGTALYYRGRDLAHFHNGHELDLRLTRRVIAAEGLQHPPDSSFHPTRSPKSPWIELRFTRASELGEIVRLVALAIKALE